MKDQSKITFGKRMTEPSAGNLASVVATCEMKTGEKTTEKASVIQV